MVVAMIFAGACSAPEGAGAAPDAPDAPGGGGGADAPGGGGDDAPDSIASCAGKTKPPSDATWTVNVGGVARTANVHVPASYDPQTRTPLVINVHGRTSNAAQQASVSRVIPKSDAAGFVVIHPQSITSPTSFNGGACCDPASTTNVDDGGFVRELIDEAAARLCIDPDRVYVMGLSNGGYMAYRAACELADRVAAVASVAGALLLSGCAPSRPVPLLHVHGDDDLIVSYTLGAQSAAGWKDRNGCTTSSTTFQNGDSTCVTHTGCTGGADVVMCTVDGGGHQWPGGVAIPLLGKTTQAMSATDAAWEFFAAHPRE